MQNNKVISIAIILTNVFQLLIILLLCASLFVVVHWHIDPQGYHNVDLRAGFQAGFGMKGIKVNGGGSHPLIMSEVNPLMMYWLLLRTLLFFFLTILILRRIRKVLYSIQSLKTFYDDNIVHLRKLGFLGMIVFLLSSFNFYSGNGESSIAFTLAFTPLFFAVGFYVLAEIFYEGKLLQEDKDQII